MRSIQRKSSRLPPIFLLRSWINVIFHLATSIPTHGINNPYITHKKNHQASFSHTDPESGNQKPRNMTIHPPMLSPSQKCIPPPDSPTWGMSDAPTVSSHTPEPGALSCAVLSCKGCVLFVFPKLKQSV
ncbi:hypothetical protein B0J18DRAFT_94857 [Chaetomium sp. MPI-SDFR-AT-0129]|nr:hypothetical protein B0J18DRAFT_94857 [Chaetomium sp. MPI-SDFR-AT-0129]